MTNSMLVVIICAFAIGILGIAELLVFFLVGVQSIWFQTLAVVQASFATVLVCFLVVSLTWIFVTVNYP